MVEGHEDYSEANWKHPAFDDAEWKSGKAELGYGEDDEATPLDFGGDKNSKHITAYFRHAFTLESLERAVSARLELKRDDGAIVYLNGAEVARDNMRRGSITGKTLANATSDDGNDFHEFTVPLGLLRSGRNVVAVEVHQTKPTSSDVSFDFALYVAEETETRSEPLRLDRNTIVRARALKDGEWSALNETFYWTEKPVAPGDLIFSELHYHPSVNGELEFIELQNVSGHAVNLRGARFSVGVRYRFSKTQNTLLSPGGRLLLVKSQYDMQQALGLDLPIAGVYQANLSNQGELLELVDAQGETLASVEYGDGTPWPSAADGKGPSLVFHGASQALGQSQHWLPGAAKGGTPGKGDGHRYLMNPLLDANNNGQADLVEYALGQAPEPPQLTVEHLEGEAGLELRASYVAWQNTAATDVRLIAEGSSDLRVWRPLNAVQTVTQRDRRLECRWTHQAAAAEAPVMFYRLRIVRR